MLENKYDFRAQLHFSLVTILTKLNYFEFETLIQIALVIQNYTPTPNHSPAYCLV